MHLIARIICFCLLPLTVSAWAAESPAVQAAAEDKAQALEQKAADKQSPKTAPEAAP